MYYLSLFSPDFFFLAHSPQKGKGDGDLRICFIVLFCFFLFVFGPRSLRVCPIGVFFALSFLFPGGLKNVL